MFGSILNIVSLLVWLVLAVTALIFLLRLFNRTQMSSLLWLIGAIIAWPLLARGISLVLPAFVMRTAAARALPISSVTSIYGLVFLVEAVIGGTLLLIAAITLERELTARMLPATAAAPSAQL